MAFSFSRSLTIDHTQCGASDSSSFPVLVSGSDTTLKVSGGHVLDSGGADILFFSDSLLTTQIASEIEFYDATNGILVAWVKVGTVSHTVDTVIYIAYGNAAPPARTTNPWDANYGAVWHLPNGSSLSLSDSTGNGNTGSLNGSVTAGAGKVDGGGVWGLAGNNWIQVASSASTNIAGKLTLEAWVKPSISNAFQCIVSKCTSAGIGREYAYFLSSAGTSNIFVALDQAATAPYTATGGNVAISTPWATGVWNHIVLSVNAAVDFRIYLNGQLVATSTGNFGAVANGAHAAIGCEFGSFPMVTATVDEVRISNTNRGADWILTEYNNQNAPGNIGAAGFLTWGTEVAASTFQAAWARGSNQIIGGGYVS